MDFSRGQYAPAFRGCSEETLGSLFNLSTIKTLSNRQSLKRSLPPISEDTAALLPKLDTRKNLSTRQYIKRQELRPIRPPHISTKETPAGTSCVYTEYCEDTGESLFRWLATNQPTKQDLKMKKPPLRMPAAVREENLAKSAMKTMGPAKVEKPSPDKYLKKHSKEFRYLEKKPTSRVPCSAARKPPIPAKTDIPPMGMYTKKNFIKTAREQISLSKGYRLICENSGHAPKYVKKYNYGEIPPYLRRRKEENRRAQQDFNNLVRGKVEQEARKYVNHEKRRGVLEDLRKRWNKLHHDYQGLSFITDNVSKRQYKKSLETEMIDLENYMIIFERTNPIFIPELPPNLQYYIKLYESNMQLENK